MSIKNLTPVFIIYFLIQLGYVIFFPLPFTSDSANHYIFAQQAIQEETYYPNPSAIYHTWLVAPVYINYLIGILTIKNSFYTILVFNIFLNTIQGLLIFIITRNIFSIRAACIASLIYILYLNNLGLVLLNYTEFMFGIFTLLSLYFYTRSSTLINNILCGLTLGLSIGTRPTGYALFLAYVALYAIDLVFFKTYQHRKIALVTGGMICYVFCMGLLSNANINRFEFTSTTGPGNLIMSATPYATGRYDDRFVKTDSTYQTKKTYFEKNEYLMKHSKEFILQNPEQWLLLIPKKIYVTFIFDGWALNTILNRSKLDLNSYLKGDKAFRKQFNQESLLIRAGFWIINIWHYILYGVIMLFILLKLVTLKRWITSRYELLIALYMLGNIAISIITSVGNARYKYNFLITGLILISPIISDQCRKLFKRFNHQRF